MKVLGAVFRPPEEQLVPLDNHPQGPARPHPHVLELESRDGGKEPTSPALSDLSETLRCSTGSCTFPGSRQQGSPTLRSGMGAGPRRGSAAAQLLRRPGSLRCPLLITFPRASGNIPPTPRESLILWDPKVALPSLRPHRFPQPPFTDPLTSQPQPLPRTPHPLPTRAPSFSHSLPHIPDTAHLQD